jgi:transcription antitermination protein NusB
VSARTRARKRALDILFEADLRDAPPLEVLGAHREGRTRAGQPPLNEYVALLVEGVTANRERIDELLSTYAIGWTLDRMPAVDRTLLRLGAYELLWRDDVPDAVAIDEAVELATALSTDESPGFVNGLLARLLELKPTLSR